MSAAAIFIHFSQLLKIFHRGWRILVLPLKDFKVESTPQIALGGDQPAIMQYPYGFFNISCATDDIRDSAKTPSPTLESDEAETTVPHTLEAIFEPTEDSTMETFRVCGLNVPRMSHLF